MSDPVGARAAELSLTAPATGSVPWPDNGFFKAAVSAADRQVEATVLIGTAAAFTIVDAGLAEALGLVPPQTVIQRQDWIAASLLTLEVAGMTMSNLAVRVVNPATTAAQIVLGTEVLDKAHASIGPRRIYFGMIEGFALAPIHYRGGVPTAQITLTGPDEQKKKIYAVLNTSARLSSVPASVAAALGVKARGEAANDVAPDASAPQYGIFKQLSLAGAPVNDVLVALSAAEHAVIGADVLAVANATIARRRNVVVPRKARQRLDAAFEVLKSKRPQDEDWSGLLVMNARSVPKQPDARPMPK